MRVTTPGAVAVAVLAATVSLRAQWPQWRGPNRDGLVAAAVVPAVWPDKPSVKWTQPLGEGYSSPVVDAGRVFVRRAEALQGRRRPDLGTACARARRDPHPRRQGLNAVGSQMTSDAALAAAGGA